MARTWRPTSHLSTIANNHEILVPTGWLGGVAWLAPPPEDMTYQEPALGDAAEVVRLQAPEKHYYLAVFPAFAKASSGVYFVPHRSAGFSISPRQPEANVAFVACRLFDRGALPRWLSESGQS